MFFIYNVSWDKHNYSCCVTIAYDLTSQQALLFQVNRLCCDATMPVVLISEHRVFLHLNLCFDGVLGTSKNIFEYRQKYL